MDNERYQKGLKHLEERNSENYKKLRENLGGYCTGFSTFRG